MEAPSSSLASPDDVVGRIAWRLSQWFALGGGLVLFGMTLMSTLSILGRWLLSRPIPGDYEIAQIGTAVAVSAFLPWCALRGGHVLVDFLTNDAPVRVRSALDTIGNLAVAVVGLLAAWRLTIGMIDLRASGETTMVLSIPTWYAYAPMIPSFALLGVVALYRAAVFMRDVVAGPPS